MLKMQTPFMGNSEKEIFKSVLKGNVLFPERIDEHAKDLIQKLLVQNPLLRLGAGPKDAKEIMKHAYFKSINWSDLLEGGKKGKRLVEFKPEKINLGLGNFDSDFTSDSPIVLTPKGSKIKSLEVIVSENGVCDPFEKL
jgi:serine/threonine protein kinase